MALYTECIDTTYKTSRRHVSVILKQNGYSVVSAAFLNSLRGSGENTMKLCIVLLSIFVLASCSDELLECHCMEGWLPQKDDSGAVNCYGDMVKSILPCNLVQKPNCVCNEQSTSVVQDSTGTWCSRVVDGTEEKKWDCENKEDWIAFYKEHPEEKP